MKLFNELIGETIEGVETEERLEICHSLLLHIHTNAEKGCSTNNNNLELATLINDSQIEVKKAKKVLETNGLIEIVKDDNLESFISLTTKGSFYVAKLKTQQLKEAMTGEVDPQREDFIDYDMDLKFVDIYNHLSYQERVVFEAVVAAILCREQYQACYFRTLGSLLDAQAVDIMPILTSLEAKGLVVLVGEKSTKVYLTNSRDFLLTHYESFYNTGMVENDFIYKTAFRYDPYSGYGEPYEFPNFEVINPEPIEFDPIYEEPVETVEVEAESQLVESVTTKADHSRVFIIDTESVLLEQFVQTAADVLTVEDHYIAVLSATRIGGAMAFTLFNHLMKLPCRGETDMVENPGLYYQFFTIQIVQAIQAYPNSDIIILTNEVSYPAIARQLKAKLNLRENQVQVMNYGA